MVWSRLLVSKPPPFYRRRVTSTLFARRERYHRLRNTCVPRCRYSPFEPPSPTLAGEQEWYDDRGIAAMRRNTTFPCPAPHCCGVIFRIGKEMVVHLASCRERRFVARLFGDTCRVDHRSCGRESAFPASSFIEQGGLPIEISGEGTFISRPIPCCHGTVVRTRKEICNLVLPSWKNCHRVAVFFDTAWLDAAGVILSDRSLAGGSRTAPFEVVGWDVDFTWR